MNVPAGIGTNRIPILFAADTPAFADGSSLPFEVYIPCISPRNHADCTAILLITDRSLLAQFVLTPKSKRGLAAREVVDPLDGV